MGGGGGGGEFFYIYILINEEGMVELENCYFEIFNE